jgi:2,3-bisphosphoglycerate-independent phosphoglycerate mutase
MAPGSDVGNMAILGYDPAEFHTGRAPIEAAALGLKLPADRVAYRCNLVTLGDDGTMVDFAAGHPTDADAAAMIAAIDAELGRGATGDRARGLEFHNGVQYRHIMVTPADWADAECTPPHDLTGQPSVWPTGPAAEDLRAVMDASCNILARFDAKATQVWLWGQGFQPAMQPFHDRYGISGGIVTAVDLVRGLGVLTDMALPTVEGANAWYDTNYEGKRDAAVAGLRDGADLFVIHVEATDEAGHAGNAEEKVKALENWDRRILADLVPALDDLGDWRMLLMPDHATPLRLKTHTADPVPYLLVGSGIDADPAPYTEVGVAERPPVPGHQLMRRLLAG